MKVEIDTSMPIKFESLNNTSEDGRFTKVKVWLCHTGLNRNNSFFSRELLSKKFNSLKNIPIVGYIDANSEKADFEGHEEKIIIEDNGVKKEYLGRAYGLIPETNNVKFEKKLDENGVEREYVTCEGLLWNKFEDAVDIINRDSFKQQSMELQPESIKGHVDKKDKKYHFSDFEYEAVCMLGDHKTPAMAGSVVEKFEKSNLKTMFEEMFDELKQSMKIEGGEIMLKKINKQKEQEILTAYDVTEQEEKVTEIEENDIEEKVNAEGIEETEQEEKIDEAIEGGEEKFEELDHEGKDDEKEKFELTDTQRVEEIIKALSKIKYYGEDYWSEKMVERTRYYYVDSSDTAVFARDRQEGVLVGFEYGKNGDYIEIKFETRRRVKMQFVDMEGEDTSMVGTSIYTKEELDDIEKQYKDKFEELEQESKELKEQLDTKKKQDKENLIKDFVALLDDEKQDLLNNIDKFEYSELEDRLYALVGRKNVQNFTTKEENNEVSAILDADNKSDSEPSYAHLIRR